MLMQSFKACQRNMKDYAACVIVNAACLMRFRRIITLCRGRIPARMTPISSFPLRDNARNFRKGCCAK